MEHINSFHAVVFDMDGVIFDSEKLVILCWQAVAEKYGIEDIETACRECFGLNRESTRQKMLLRYGADFPYDAYKREMSELFHSRYSGGKLPLKPGVIELLQYLKEHHIRIALASSTRSQVVRQELSDAGILAYFDAVICGDMVERSKPAPDIFLKACEKLEVNTAVSFAVEDSYNGIRSANAAGLRTIMVPDLAEPTSEMEQLTEIILPDLIHVKQYFMEKAN